MTPYRCIILCEAKMSSPTLPNESEPENVALLYYGICIGNACCLINWCLLGFVTKESISKPLVFLLISIPYVRKFGLRSWMYHLDVEEVGIALSGLIDILLASLALLTRWSTSK